MYLIGYNIFSHAMYHYNKYVPQGCVFVMVSEAFDVVIIAFANVKKFIGKVQFSNKCTVASQPNLLPDSEHLHSF